MRVYYGKKSAKSGRVLAEALSHVDGSSVNFGYQHEGQVNPAPAVRLAANKRLALQAMAEAGVPTPEVKTDINEINSYPVVARPDKHRAGKEFYLCHTQGQAVLAAYRGCTHFLDFIEGGREFRVHVAFGKSIKIAEKIGGDPIIKNFEKGSTFMYPQNFNHKLSLRKYAKQAVEALGLDFGAVDIIYKDGRFYVLEVNTAPSLTSRSDILERYVRAFKERFENE